MERHPVQRPGEAPRPGPRQPSKHPTDIRGIVRTGTILLLSTIASAANAEPPFPPKQPVPSPRASAETPKEGLRRAPQNLADWCSSPEAHVLKNELSQLLAQLHAESFYDREEATKKLTEFLFRLRKTVYPVPPEFSPVFGALEGKRPVDLSLEQWERIRSVQGGLTDREPLLPATLPPMNARGFELLSDLEGQLGFTIRCEEPELLEQLDLLECEIVAGKNSAPALLVALCERLNATVDVTGDRALTLRLHGKNPGTLRATENALVLMHDENGKRRLTVVPCTPRGRPCALVSALSKEDLPLPTDVSLVASTLPAWKNCTGPHTGPRRNVPASTSVDTHLAHPHDLRLTMVIVDKRTSVDFSPEQGGSLRIGFQELSPSLTPTEDQETCLITITTQVFDEIPWINTSHTVDMQTYAAAETSEFLFLDATGASIPYTRQTTEINFRTMKFSLVAERQPTTIRMTAPTEILYVPLDIPAAISAEK